MSGGEAFFEGLDEARRSGEARARVAVSPGLSLLAEVTELLNSPIDRFDAVLEAVLDATIRTTGADRGLLMLYDDEGNLEPRLARNLNLETLPEHARRVSRTIVDEVVRGEKGVCIADVAESGRFQESASVHDLRLLSVMCVPLKVTVRPGKAEEKRGLGPLSTRKILGVVYVDSQSVKTTFRESDLELFTALANAATTAIVHAETFRRATTDELTGLTTRRHLERRLKDELSLARRTKTPLSILMVDVDHLREMNQSSGYEAGDEVLRKVARTLRSRTRALDTAGRYGGEEFLVVLPHTDQDGAEEVARKLILTLQDQKVAVSVGVASLAGPDDTAERLTRRADQALAKAKDEGAGRARCWSPDLAHLVRRADKLAGIFGGDAAANYRNVLMLLESIPAIHAGIGLERILPRVVESVVELTRAERGFIFLRNEKGELTARVGRDRRRRDAEAKGYAKEIVERVVQSGEPASATDPAAGAVLCVPIAVRGAPAGAAYVDGAGASGFDDAALAFMAEFARQAAIAIENARLLEENQEKARKIEKLMHATESKKADLERRLEATAQLAPETEVPSEARKRLEVRYNYDKIVGESKSMRGIFKLLDKVTDSSVPVFIFGESGTGKELVAKAIHFNGPRKGARFIAENCAALTESLLESELFGSMKGAYTGATADKKGLFELASGGTIFLDEVGDMTSAMQMKLLRVLQEGEVRRVGGKDSIKIDVRVISASNKDLRRLVDEGKFREDLFYRLNVVRVALPPLRERREDIPLLVEHFLRDDGDARVARKTMGRPALDLLLRYPWPGNIRELKNVVDRAKILSEGAEIGTDALILDNEWAEGTLDAAGQPPAFPERTGGEGWGAGRAGPSLGMGGGVPYEPRMAPPPRASAFPGDGDGAYAQPQPQFAQGRTTPPPPPGLRPGSPLEPIYFELNERQRKLIQYLETYGSIKNRDYYNEMKISKSTGWRDLEQLIKRSVIIVQGKGKGSVYSLHEQYSGRPAAAGAQRGAALAEAPDIGDADDDDDDADSET